MIYALNKVKPPFNINRAALFAAVESIRDVKWLNKEIKHVNRWVKIFYNNFKIIGIETNFSHGNFLLVNFNKIKKNAKKIFLRLAKSGILVRKMDTYKIKNSLRITIGNNLENIKLINTLKKII